MHDALRTPLRIGGLEVPGRLFKSATHETRATVDGAVTDELLDFYRPMVEAGTPLIVTGNLFVSWQGKSAYRQGGIHSDEMIPGLREWADLAHSGGSALFAQLNHGGRQMTKPAEGVPEAISASNRREKAQGTKPRPLRLDEVPALLETYAAAAGRAQEAGLDGVQIQMAHGYFLSQFLSPESNRRHDAYGGSARARMQLPLEVYRAVRDRVGPDFPVIIKINGTDTIPWGGVKLADQIELALRLQDEGIDAVEVTRGHFSSFPSTTSGHFKGYVKAQLDDGAMREASPKRRAVLRALGPLAEFGYERAFRPAEGYNLPQAQEFSRALDIPVITVGGFRDPVAMNEAISSGKTSAVSSARGLIANPYLYRELDDPAANITCTLCNKCIGVAGGLPVACYDPTVLQRREAAGLDIR
ncbi:NADH oxidase [Gordonia spumicola]|uniref:NADH oxidase n=1 Tax=Gordonia spumicola TaxID=589161 RepID=A0A7I9V956_9ACTN|nr:NADH:flavin oxidoreductase [Gordonia spumicola]GEE00755.1 NADH oxidase [Gordonia spumicola]GEE00768.1 NADH oxidase [Gordonia spumicola]GEE01772.1 NADH oxidase [Gordonia spumicola]